jgi:hypothetical protein
MGCLLLKWILERDNARRGARVAGSSGKLRATVSRMERSKSSLAMARTSGLLVPPALVLHFGVVKHEERYLEAKFSEAYRVYKGNVPRHGGRSSKQRLR